MNAAEIGVWVGVAIAAAFWGLTQFNIVKTRRDVSAQVRAATINLTAHTDKKVSEFTESVHAKIDARLKPFEDVDFDVDFTPITDELTALKTQLPDLISTHIDMHMKSLQAQEAKMMASFIENLNVDGIAEEQKAALVERLTTGQKVAMKAMMLKIPKATQEKYPLGYALFNQTRGEVAAGIMQYLDGIEGGGVSVENARRGGSFNPGYNP